LAAGAFADRSATTVAEAPAFVLSQGGPAHGPPAHGRGPCPGGTNPLTQRFQHWGKRTPTRKGPGGAALHAAGV